MRFLLAVLLASCGGSTPLLRLPDEGDARILQQVLDGKVAPDDGLRQVAYSGGFPVQTTQGYVFALRDDGTGPYKLLSPSGAFADTQLQSQGGIAVALVPVAQPAGATYRYTNKVGDRVSDGWSRLYTYQAGLEVGLVAATGPHFERWPALGAGGVAARAVRVWIPAQAPTHFLYAHDGQNLFGPNRQFCCWHLEDAAGPTTLVVGIDNTSARIDEYTHVPDTATGKLQGGQGAAYLDFVEGTVRPFIEARYGTPKRSGLIGSSLGGLISAYAWLRKPGQWDFVASLSGTMGWGSFEPGKRGQTVIDLAQQLAACPSTPLYVDAGGGPGGTPCVDSDGDGIQDDDALEHDNYCENVQFVATLQAKGCAPTWKWAQDAQHNEAAWSARAPAIVAQFEAL